MFLFKQIGVTYTLFVCASAIKCYEGQISAKEKGPPSQVKNCPKAKYCVRVSGGNSLYDCDDINFYCKKEGCETTKDTKYTIVTCCCTSDLCNGGMSLKPKLLSALLFTFYSVVVKLLIH